MIFVSDKWSPALQIRTVLLSIQALLSAPNPDDPLANDVAEQWKVNESQAIQTGKLLILSRVSSLSTCILTNCAKHLTLKHEMKILKCLKDYMNKLAIEKLLKLRNQM